MAQMWHWYVIRKCSCGEVCDRYCVYVLHVFDCLSNEISSWKMGLRHALCTWILPSINQAAFPYFWSACYQFILCIYLWRFEDGAHLAAVTITICREWRSNLYTFRSDKGIAKFAHNHNRHELSRAKLSSDFN